MTSTFLQEFDQQYAPRLGKRRATFRKMFELMEAQGRPLNIIETGCARLAGNWEGDGQSSIMFDRFLHHHNACKLDIYDISPQSVSCCKALVSHPNTTVHCEDSVKGLWNYPRDTVDVLYLDSFDVDFNKPHPSAFHHIKELCAIMRLLRPGAIIMVDDNENGRGKGQYIHDFMLNIGATVVMSEYQILFQLNGA